MVPAFAHLNTVGSPNILFNYHVTECCVLAIPALRFPVAVSTPGRSDSTLRMAPMLLLEYFCSLSVLVV